MRNWMVLFGGLLALGACDDGDGSGGSVRRTIRGDGARDSGVFGEGSSGGGSSGGGSSGGGSSGGGSTEDRELADLSPSESFEFCQWLSQLEDRSLTGEQYCTQEASEEADDPDECEELRDECIESFEEDEPIDCEGAEFPSDCTATAAEFKRCLTDFARLVNTAVRRATCDDPELGRTPSQLPSTCATIPDACFDF